MIVLRFGKSIETFYGCLKTVHYNDSWLAFTLTVSRISQTIFLVTDHIIWLARSGLVKNVDVAKWSQKSNKYWLISLIMGIVRDIYEINRVISSYTKHKSLSTCIASSVVSVKSSKDLANCFTSLLEFFITYKHLSVDTIKNLCDIFIPLNSLGFVRLSPRTIGLLGMISSIAGLIVILNPSTCKLTPQ
jgi:peroxin-11B